ncbi:MAG: hypothetical protein ACT4SY_12870 [Hyphomicrobiales bacterium]
MDPRRRDKRPGGPDAPARRDQSAQALEPAALRSRPANENDPGTSMMLAKLRRQPSFAPYYVAFILSLGWIAGWFFIFSNSVIAVPDPFGPRLLADTMRALALLVLPIGVVWVTAYFLWRASQLRQVSEVLMQSAMRLIRPQDIATEGLTSIAQAVRSEVDLLVGGVEHAVQRATALEEIVHKEISAIERAFGGNEERIRGLVTGLENQRAALHQASMVLASEANPVLARLEFNTENLGGIIVNAQSTLVQLEEGLKETSAGLARTIDEVASRAATASGQIGTQTAQIERVSGILTGELSDFSLQLQDRIESLSQTAGLLDSESTNFGRSVQAMESSVVQLLRQSADQLSGVNQDIGRTIEDATAAAAGEIKQAAAGLTEVIQGAGGSVSGQLNMVSNEVAALMERATAASAGEIKQAAAGLTEVIQGTGNNIAYHLNATSNEVASLIERSGIDVSQQIEQSRNLVTQGLEQVATGYLGRIGQAQDNFSGLLDRATGEMAGTIERTASGVAGELQAAGSAVNELLVTTSGTITAHLKETSGIVGRQMQDSGLALAQNIEGSGGLVTDRLISVSGEFVQNAARARDDLLALFDSSANEMTARLDRTAGDMTDRLESSATRIHDHINATAGGAVSRMVGATDKLTVQLDQASTELGGLLDTTTSRLDAQLGEAVTGLTELFRTNTGMMTGQLLKTSGEVAAQLDAAGSTMFTRLDATARDLGERFDVASTLLERVTGDISGRLASTGTKFAEIVGTAGTQMISDLDKASVALSHGLGETTLQITGRFEQNTGLLAGRIDQAAREFDSATTATSAKLDDAHRKFSKHVETANIYLADQLAGAAGALDERLEGISMQLTGKLEMTGSRISERLEDVSALVEKSLDKFNGDMERVLVNRRDALDQLLSDANRKAQEIDAVMTGYMNLIEESLTASETRSKDIGRIVSEQTAAAAANLEQEIKKLEASSGGQIGQAARILREQHERAMASMNEMLSATASDFQQTAQDMRITAQQVVKDIDTARSELKRAILDLPEETRSNADAMRRVVADQIAALNALAEVVKRQTGTLDVSGPGVTLPRIARDPSLGKSEGAAHPASQSAGALDKSRDRNEAVESSIARSMAVLLPRPAGPAEAAPDSAGIPREMENLVQKLNAAARDLVEAIDGSLPRDLEKSFNAGERHVYTHRLYEARGKRFVKMIVDRYGSERLVRGRVDAYVRLFERLLDTVSEVPQGAGMVEACLASESGKLYVTLAEAAGRIPPQ